MDDTKQVDHTNAFYHAEIREEVHIETRKGFGGLNEIPKVLR